MNEIASPAPAASAMAIRFGGTDATSRLLPMARVVFQNQVAHDRSTNLS